MENTKFNAIPPHQIMYYVYILKSEKDEDMYTGSTNDLKRRFEEHNTGKVQSSRHRRPFRLVYYEAYSAEKDARQRESNLKLGSRAYTQLRRRIAESLK